MIEHYQSVDIHDLVLGPGGNTNARVPIEHFLCQMHLTSFERLSKVSYTLRARGRQGLEDLVENLDPPTNSREQNTEDHLML